jgi:tRNA (guanine-N7-)-methyltransferase
VGADRPGSRAEVRVRALNTKPPADRLYGRVRGHALRPRQQRLLDIALPRLRFPVEQASDPASAFSPPPDRLALEIGFGGGEHAAAQAEEHPDTGLIACEVFANGLCSLLSRLAPEPADEATWPLPGNLRLWDDDARILLRDLPDACLDTVFLMFPDPWPKARHVKRRFVHPAQVPLIARVLKPGGVWRVASDDPTYQAWVTEVMGAQSLFAAAAPAHERPEGWPPTRYEAKALRAGRRPLYWCFIRGDARAETDAAEEAWNRG